MLRWFGTRFDRQVKVLVGEVEEQSVLAAEQARRAKDRLTKEFEQVPGYKGVIHISWRLSNRRATRNKEPRGKRLQHNRMSGQNRLAPPDCGQVSKIAAMRTVGSSYLV